jgi:hypothetical protein
LEPISRLAIQLSMSETRARSVALPPVRFEIAETDRFFDRAQARRGALGSGGERDQFFRVKVAGRERLARMPSQRLSRRRDQLESVFQRDHLVASELASEGMFPRDMQFATRGVDGGGGFDPRVGLAIASQSRPFEGGVDHRVLETLGLTLGHELLKERHRLFFLAGLWRGFGGAIPAGSRNTRCESRDLNPEGIAPTGT